MTGAQIQIETESEAQTIALARALGKRLKPGDLVALFGDLGAGKTRFVRGLASGLGHDPTLVSSPTFVIINEYATSDDSPPLVHVDAYRLSGPEDLATIAWDPSEVGESIAALEWAERLADALPETRIDVDIEHTGDDRRRITITPRGAHQARLAGLLEDLENSA